MRKTAFLLSAGLAYLFSGCSGPPNAPSYTNPFDERGQNYVPPAVTSVTVTVNGRDAAVSWTGTTVVSTFTYRLDNDASANTLVTSESFTDLAEGVHSFTILGMTHYKAGADTTVSFSIDAIKGPGIALSPRRITEQTKTVRMLLDEVDRFMGGRIEVSTGGCAEITGFTLNSDIEKTYHVAYFVDLADPTRLVLEMACLSGRDGISGTVEIGQFTVKTLSTGEIKVDSIRTQFRDIANTLVTLRGFDFVRVLR